MSNSGSLRGRQRSPTTYRREKGSTSAEPDDQPATPQRLAAVHAELAHVATVAGVPAEELLVADLDVS